MATPRASDCIAFWQLDPKNEGQPATLPRCVQPFLRSSGILEIGFTEEQKDIRMPVNDADIKPGGKYHSIVKLFLQRGGSEAWSTATGWLLKNNVVVTAGHCVYERGQRATRVKACVGYNAGSESFDVAAAEQRSVRRIAVPLEWVNEETEQQNVAFLQLDSPFQNVMPLVCGTPEIHVRQQLTVVGYPADVYVGGVPGGGMYEMKIDRDINLERTRFNMLIYQGDLEGGYSGAPVIRDSDSTAIGVHVLGGSINCAANIGGAYGVRFQALEWVMRMLEKGGGTNYGVEVRADHALGWLKIVHVPRNAEELQL